MAKAIVSERISLKNILYATDFSRYSDAALPFALSVSRRYGSRLFALHVISFLPFPNVSPTPAWQAMAAQALREAKEAMARLEPQWREIPHEKLIRKGDIWTELSKTIEEKEIDLAVIGTHGRTGVSRALMGSVAEKIFRHAPCPVLTVGPNIAGEPESIGDIHTVLYPVDFAAESLAAAPYAVSLAQENQARLYLLHVTASPVSAGTEAALLSRLRNLVPSEGRLSCEPKPFVESGVPAQKILDLTEELAVDLIVLGPKREPKLPASTHLPMATAYHVASQAICPVLTVRSER